MVDDFCGLSSHKNLAIWLPRQALVMKWKFRFTFIPPAIFLPALLLMAACSSEKNTLVSKSYHDLTSRYNALFIAKEIIRDIESDIERNQIYNYDEILRIFPPIDSLTMMPYMARLDEAIEKAGLIIQFHGNSQFVDDAYYLIGKARYYKMEWMESIETLRFVNVISEDVDLKHRALILLMRVYMADNKYNLAEEVADYLKRKEMTRDNLAAYYLTQAYFYQRRGDLDNMVLNLSEATPLLREKKEVPRINFLLAQVYQQLGFDGGAYESYRQVVRNSKDYRMTLYARLFMQQVAQMNKVSDVEKARKFYQGMLKEGKNAEFVDRIYIELGAFEERNQNYDRAKATYRKAIDNAQNSRNRALAYLAMAELIYGVEQNYIQAKLYFDSVMLDLPPSYSRFAEISATSKALTGYYNAENTIVVKDSLLGYANLTEAELERLAERLAEDRAKQYKEEMARIRAREEREARGRLLQNLGFGSGRAAQTGSSWYFYNQTAMAQGQLEFRRVWGNRQLQDNWRRSQPMAGMPVGGMAQAMIEPSDQGEAAEDPGFDKQAFINEFLAAVPMTVEMQQEYRDDIERALFEKAKILKFDLGNNPHARETFLKFLEEYPKSDMVPEALYFLYLLAMEEKSPDAERWKQRLVTEHPNTLFAMALLNPEYLGETEGIVDKVRQIYANAYRLYESGMHLESRSILQNAFLDFPPTEFSDNLRYLELMNIARTENELVFRETLDRFIQDFPDSDLINFANRLDSIYSSRRLELFLQVAEGYKTGEIGPYYLVLRYDDYSVNTETWVEKMVIKAGDYQERIQLRDSKFNMRNEHPLLIVSGFSGWDQAMWLFQQMKNEKFDDARGQEVPVKIFVIDNRNLERLYRQGDLNEYLAFFKTHYLQQ
jgi:tetratricopeptide (TPR) repeat protein